MSPADQLNALIACAVILTVVAAIVCVKATLTLREAQRRNTRLKRQSAELEAEKAKRTQILNLAAHVMLRNSDLFAGARKYKEL